jgi:hypothetical protein
MTFRPERAFVLAAPLTELGKSKVRLDAGTAMVGMKTFRASPVGSNACGPGRGISGATRPLVGAACPTSS